MLIAIDNLIDTIGMGLWYDWTPSWRKDSVQGTCQSTLSIRPDSKGHTKWRKRWNIVSMQLYESHLEGFSRNRISGHQHHSHHGHRFQGRGLPDTASSASLGYVVMDRKA